MASMMSTARRFPARTIRFGTPLTNAPGGEPTRNLPRIRSGDLQLSRGGKSGALTSGSFSMRFEDSGGDLGFGRTLNSNFVANQTRDAGFGDLP